MTCGAVAVAVAARARRAAAHVWPGCFEAVAALFFAGGSRKGCGRAAVRPLGLPDAQAPVRERAPLRSILARLDPEFVIGS